MSIHSMSEQDVLGVVTPIAESMQTGWDNDDYSLFAEHFFMNFAILTRRTARFTFLERVS